LGLIAVGETPTADEMQDGLEGLQTMLRVWAAKRLLVFASVKESFTLVSGTASYTWGSGGTINTTRPHQILGAFVRDSSNIDHPVDVISEGRYRNITSKTTSGRPDRLFYHPLYPLAYIYLHPTPDTAETLWLDSMKPFTETSSFGALTDTISFPLNYEEPLVYGLAVRLAPEFGKAVSAEVAAIASSSYDSLITLNAANQVEPVRLSLPVGMQTAYDINAG
jgi:hypothetical protein